MARISTYGPDQALHLKDKVLGSSYIRTVNSVDEFETQNFTLEELKGFLDGELSVSTLKLKPNGGLVTEVITGVTYLAVDLSATNITGALANSDLANSSITINGTAISLGGSVTTPDTNTQLSTEEVQDIVGAMVSGNTETNIAVTYNDTDGKLNFAGTDTNTFRTVKVDSSAIGATEALDIVAGNNITLSESNGEVTIDATDTNTQLSTEQVQDIVGAMFSGNTETRISATYEDSDGTIDLTVDDMTANTQLTTEEVQDIVGAMVSGNTENNISVTYDDSSGKLNFDSTDTDTNTQLTTEQVRAKFTEGTNITISNGEISATDTNTQLSTEQVQDIVGAMVSSNTETNISVTYDDTNGKLDFVSTDTNTDTNNYVTGASVSGTTTKTITLTRQGLSDITANWTDIDTVYTLPAATTSALGGIKIGYTENAKNYPVELDSDKAYVNVPWTDTVYTLPLAASGTRGGVKIGYSENGKNYPVELSSEQMYVNVPWTDTVYTLPVASSSLGGIKIGYTDNGKNYAVELDGDNEAYVNVPWTDTTYTLPTAASNVLGGVKVGSNLTIDGNGVLNVGAIALTTVQTAANESAHLALTTEEGDVVVRTDQNKSYVKNSGTAGNMNDFTELLSPTDAVTSVKTTDGTYIDLSPNTPTTGAINITADLSAVNGTSDTTTRFLSQDNTWDVPSYTSNTFRTIKVDTTNNGTANETIGSTEELKLIGGTAISLAESAGAVTINGVAETYTEHDNISAASSVDNSGRTYIQDITLDSNGHVTGITSATETVVNTDTNTNQLTEWTLRDDDDDDVTIDHNTFVKFEAATGALNTDITGAGTTANPYVVTITSPDSTIANTFRTIKVDTNNNGTANETIGASEELKLVGGTNVTLAEADGKVTITSTDTNTFRTVQVDGSSIGATETLNLIGGTNVTLTENNGAITIASTDTDTVYTHPSHDGDDIDIDTTALTGATVISDLDFNITTDTEGHVTDANGAVVTRDLTLADLGYTGATDANNYSLPAATSTVRGGVELFSDTVQSVAGESVSTTANRTYGVQVNSSGQMVVNVPWSDTDTDTNTNILSGGTITGDVTVNGDMTFEDDHKLELGTGADLDLYHASGHSYIDNNTGNLYIRCNPSGEIHIRPKESENGVIIRDDGKTELYFDDAKKLETVTGGVNVTGTLTASADVVAYSDERLKTDIKTLDGSKVYDMRGVSFIKDNKQSSGVIAQELEEIAPELVNNDGEYKSVAYGNITGYLIEAIKDLKKEIEECKKQKCNCNASSR